MALISGHNALGRLVEVLGLQNQHVRRLVLVFDVNDAVMAYVQRYVNEEEVDGVADLVGSLRPHRPLSVCHVGRVDVDEQGRVFVPADEYGRVIGAARRALECLRADAVEAAVVALDHALTKTAPSPSPSGGEEVTTTTTTTIINGADTP